MLECANVPDPTDPNTGFLQSVPALVATLLAAIAVVIYPLGFVVFWIQLWLDYTHNSAVALHAASLVPVPVAAIAALTVLQTTLLIGGAAVSVVHGSILLFVMRGKGRNLQFFPESNPEGEEGGQTTASPFAKGKKAIRQHAINPIKKRLTYPLILLMITVVVLACVLLGFKGFVRFDEGTDYVWLIPFLVVTVVVGGLATYRTITGNASLRRELANIFLIIYLGAIVASLTLVPLQQLSLPRVEFSDGPVETATLIAHKDGYWYVIEDCQNKLSAVEKESVGTVKISG